VEGLRLGAVDFVYKPFQSEELLARVRTHLELARLRAQLEVRVAERSAELLVANRQLQLDLVERRLAEQALRESEERFRNMADTAPVMFWVSGEDKLCTFFNKRWLDFTGRSIEEELGDGWTASVHPDDLERRMNTYSSSFDARQDYEMEYRLRRADGEYRWIMAVGVPRFEPGGRFAGYIGSCIDVTDFKRNQEQILATQKLESLGVIAAGMAHDLNNMLGSIFAETDLALSESPSDSPVRNSLGRIGAVAGRASEVLNLLMASAGGHDDGVALELIDPSSLVEEMRELLKISISKKAVFTTNLAKDLPPVRANPTQIQRVVTNLVINASEALEDKEGSICMTTVRMWVGPETRINRLASLPEGEYVLLEISDTGCGMTEPTLAKAFDPFYTTKFLGRGLGLSAVQGIVRSYGGAINVKSAPGKGSTFQVFLPCIREHLEAKRQATPAVAAKPAHRNRTIFLVEDEETLRLAVSMSLRKRGFSVVAAADGHDAIRIFRTKEREIDAILLDVTLPGLSGPEVLREIRKTRPEIRVIFTSAYDREIISANSAFGGESPSAFIRKPYRIGELVCKLEEALDQSESKEVR